MKKKENLAFKILIGLLLLIYSIVLLSLFVYALINSFKDSFDFIIDPVGFPKKGAWHPENYSTIFSKLYMQKDVRSPKYYIESMFAGSVLYALLSAIAVVAATTMVAYACAMYDNIASKIIYFIALFIIVVPIIGSLPSEMKIIRQLHLYDNIFSTLFLKFSFGNLYFLLLYEAFKRIPKDYEEAAIIDGASSLSVMIRIMIPITISLIGSVFLVQFIAFWNDYSTPVLYYPSSPNISVGLIDFAFSTSGPIAKEPLKLGACIVSLLPMLIVYTIFQKSLLNGISSGGIKG